MTAYSPVSDITVVSICMVMIELILVSYVRKTQNFRIFLMVIGSLMLASFSNVTYHMLVEAGNPDLYALAYGLRCFHHAFLFLIFVLFAVYITEAGRLGGRRIPYIIAALLIFTATVVADVVVTLMGLQRGLSADGSMIRSFNVFPLGYAASVALMVILLILVRNRVYRNVMLGFYGAVLISFFMLLTQGRHGQSSYTVATFLYPVIAMFYIMHSTPYDIQLGAVDVRTFEDVIRSNYERRNDFVITSLYLRPLSEEGKPVPEGLNAAIRKYTVERFRRDLLCRVSQGHYVLFIPKKYNPRYQQMIADMMKDFYVVGYDKFKMDYKIILCDSIDAISRDNEYINLFKHIHGRIPENTVHRVEEDDVSRFRRTEYILRQLNEICIDPDLDDPRVLAYCQPVFNLKTQKYDTAEALMRLRLDDTGMVFPDEFIPLAEENGYIHSLTRIILHKTCRQLADMLREGYHVSRVSVNVSVKELRSEEFCNDVTGIIQNSGVPGDKIAIELTESQNEAEFLIMKNKIMELKEKGIKFYLDDFGTGYSNMERIMELPFDIIKFDRSLVLASGASERSRQMVLGLARIFAEMKYAILYEGVEEDSDEKMCMGMAASYLQGYRYSKPVPIGDLTGFFEKQQAGTGQPLA